MHNPPSQTLIVPLTRRLKVGAWRLGNVLGDRVLVGRTLGGSPITLSMRDHQHRAIYFYGEHEPDITALFRRLVSPGDTVLDVGANVGYFSILARELGASAHAFEPNPAVRALLVNSAKLGAGSIEVVAAACSNHIGKMSLYVAEPGNTGLSSLSAPTTAPAARQHEVDVITLDDYAQRTGVRPSVIKIDVEGHEREVLAGAEQLLQSARPTVIAETGSPETLEFMRGLGFTAHRILADGSLAAHDGQLQLIGGYENICFVPGPA